MHNTLLRECYLIMSIIEHRISRKNWGNHSIRNYYLTGTFLENVVNVDRLFLQEHILRYSKAT